MSKLFQVALVAVLTASTSPAFAFYPAAQSVNGSYRGNVWEATWGPGADGNYIDRGTCQIKIERTSEGRGNVRVKYTPSHIFGKALGIGAFDYKFTGTRFREENGIVLTIENYDDPTYSLEVKYSSEEQGSIPQKVIVNEERTNLFDPLLGKSSNSRRQLFECTQFASGS